MTWTKCAAVLILKITHFHIFVNIHYNTSLGLHTDSDIINNAAVLLKENKALVFFDV